MKNIFKLLGFTLVAASVLTACKKDYANHLGSADKYSAVGVAPILSTSLSTVTVARMDSSKTLLTLSFTNPNYSVDSSNKQFVLQVDSSGQNFANPLTIKTIKGTSLSTTLMGSDLAGIVMPYLNAATLASIDMSSSTFSYDAVNMPTFGIEFRVISSYLNGGEPLTSNTVKVLVKSYANIAPKVPLPSTGTLFFTGGATPAGWQAGNSSDAPNASGQQFTKIGWGVYQKTAILKGGQQYLLLPAYGSWSHKFAGTGASDGSNNPAGDSFQYDTGSNLAAPATTGSYTLTFNFNTGKFVVQ